jgi:hypothetical protein
MACQWNANTGPNNQRNSMQDGMYQGASQPMQMPTCSQMTDIRTRNGQSPISAGMPAQSATTSGTLLPPPGAETPSTVQSPYYTAGFLRNFIGCNMRVEFLIGTSGALVDRIGVLMEVGASYIVLQPFQSDDLLMCDLYSIKFVTIYG